MLQQIKVKVHEGRVQAVLDLAQRMNLHPEFITIADTCSIIFLTDSGTASLVEQLKAIGVGTIFGEIVITHVDCFVDSRAPVVDGQKESRTMVHGGLKSLDEMIAQLVPASRVSFPFIILATIAGALASFGLYYDNVLIIIACMIIAPDIGPIAYTVVSTIRLERKHAWTGIAIEFVCLSLSVAAGAVIGALLPLPAPIPSQVLENGMPSVGNIIFAMLTGLAAGLFIQRGEGTGLVGVAIAGSLTPPAANIGMLLVNWHPELLLGSLELLLLNVLSIYLSCMAIFWISRSMVRGGTMSTRQYLLLRRRYPCYVMAAFAILVVIIIAILA